MRHSKHPRRDADIRRRVNQRLPFPNQQIFRVTPQPHKNYRQCNFKETLGFNVQFDQLVNKYHQNIGMKIGEFFDLDKHICRVKFNEFSPENKLKWSVHTSEVVVGMS
jgi:hypothetical protein